MGTRLNRLVEAVLTSTDNLCFEQKYEKYQSFSSENFQFLEVKFSIYLNRRVFVMFLTYCMLSGVYGMGNRSTKFEIMSDSSQYVNPCLAE